MKKTALYPVHLAHHAQMVPFAGFLMPLHYGSQLDEHKIVRQQCGVFDVSHMLAIKIQGVESKAFLEKILANNIGKLKEPCSSLYTCLLNEQGGILDDLIAYYLAPNDYLVVVNAGRRAADLAWFEKQAQPFKVTLTPCEQTTILAIQGPQACEKLKPILGQALGSQVLALKRFGCMQHQDWLIARTGYTGEDGVEMLLPNADGVAFFEQCLAQGIAPIGLGARDTLRLEAGFNLYGQDMTEHTHPFESNLKWSVAFKPDTRDFIGKKALLAIQEAGIQKKLVLLRLIDKGVLRQGQKIFQDNNPIGVITSGGFSPTEQCGIALARIDANSQPPFSVEIRGKPYAVELRSQYGKIS